MRSKQSLVRRLATGKLGLGAKTNLAVRFSINYRCGYNFGSAVPGECARSRALAADLTAIAASGESSLLCAAANAPTHINKGRF